MVHEGLNRDPLKLSRSIHNRLTEHLGHELILSQMKCLKWNPLPAEVHKLNYDAAIQDQMTYLAVANRSVDG